MATETVNPPAATAKPPADGPSITGLVSGILGDAQTLLHQQTALARAEFKAEVHRAVQAAVLLAAGAVIMLPALFLLANVLVYFLHEEDGLTWWASHGVVGAAFAVVGVIPIALGVQRYRAIGSFPDQSVEALKENLRWLANPK
jgi:hypothetical protein